ncbi:MAG: 30S ribosomal protein S9, partial [Planctomycetota bacterium]|nr:30S ribosomal protein S9 [Planctomycetota bacterium]
MIEDPANESLEPTSPTEMPSAAAVEAAPAPAPSGPDAHGWWRGTGRRKTAVARVRIKSGSGSFKVNDRDLENYFSEERDLKNIRNVLEKTGTLDAVDIFVNARGGGFMGQAGAIILGLGR